MTLKARYNLKPDPKFEGPLVRKQSLRGWPRGWSSSVARGVQWGIFTPKIRLLSTRYNEVLAFYNKNVNINDTFKLKLSNCTPQAKLLGWRDYRKPWP